MAKPLTRKNRLKRAHFQPKSTSFKHPGVGYQRPEPVHVKESVEEPHVEVVAEEQK